MKSSNNTGTKKSNKLNQQEQRDYTQSEDSSEMLDESENQSSQDEFKQKQAFYVPDVFQGDNDNKMDVEEYEAFQYLLSVRKEAENIKEKKRLSKIQYKRMKKQEKKIEKIQSQVKKQKQMQEKLLEMNQNQNCMEKQSDQQEQVSIQRKSIAEIDKIRDKFNKFGQWFLAWKTEVIQNWNCLVQNFKYLHKNPQFIPVIPSIPSNNFQSSQSLLSQKPTISFIAKLTLSKIQQMVSQLSQCHYHNSYSNYYLWVYSLLAAHRALASYWSFEALADINACLAAQDIKKEDSEKKNVGNQHYCEKLTLCCVVENEFRQRYSEQLYAYLISSSEKVI